MSGAFNPTSSQTCPLNDWPEMLAHTVYVALVAVEVGVPVMVQVPAVKLSPVGSEGDIAQVAPLTAADGKAPVSRYVWAPFTLTGLVRSDTEDPNPPLSPTWPEPRLPQHFSWPLSSWAQVCVPPAERAIAVRPSPKSTVVD